MPLRLPATRVRMTAPGVSPHPHPPSVPPPTNAPTVFLVVTPCSPTPSCSQLFTIHNMDFGQIKLGEAAYYCQKFTTVSPSYAWEVRGTAAEEQLRTGVIAWVAAAHL